VTFPNKLGGVFPNKLVYNFFLFFPALREAATAKLEKKAPSPEIFGAGSTNLSPPINVCEAGEGGGVIPRFVL
jgi:hypothetical protein